MPFRYADSSQMKWLNVAFAAQTDANEPTPAQMYAALDAYYLNNGLYDAIQKSAEENGIWTESMKGIRNPAYRVVEFYVSKIAPGHLPDALPIQTENDAIIDPIHQIWTWSNFSVRKQLATRWFAEYGDLFIKISSKKDDAGEPTRVYFQLLKSHYVTEIKSDERDYLTYVRIDVPSVRKNGESVESYIYTEIWNKSTQSMKIWKHNKGVKTLEERLGDPITVTPFSDYGIDFVPIVQAKFRDIGDDRGLSSFAHALDKIDEINRMATRLHQMLFRYNKPIWAISANSIDATGRPLPAPRLSDTTGTADSDTITIGDDSLFRLPGMSKLESMVPTVDYAAYVAEIAAQLEEIERDLPELAYYRLRDKTGELSGVAVRLLLSDAIDKAKEARGNFETAIVRANQMALTIAQNAGLVDPSIGSYEDGSFDHDFADRDVIPLSEKEKFEIVKSAVDTGIPLPVALKRVGWTDDEIKDVEKQIAKEKEEDRKTLGTALLNAQRDFDRGNNQNNQNPPPNNNGDQTDDQTTG